MIHNGTEEKALEHVSPSKQDAVCACVRARACVCVCAHARQISPWEPPTWKRRFKQEPGVLWALARCKGDRALGEESALRDGAAPGLAESWAAVPGHRDTGPSTGTQGRKTLSDQTWDTHTTSPICKL